jgi:hypothetical protein
MMVLLMKKRPCQKSITFKTKLPNIISGLAEGEFRGKK